MDYYVNLGVWADHTVRLLQQPCVAATAAFVLFRLPRLRRAVARADEHWPSLWLLIGLFGALAVFGTHAGAILDAHRNVFVERPAHLKAHASIDIRDVIVIVAGLTSGVRVGVGVIAALDRYAFGTFVAESAALASAVLGLGAGLLRHFRPEVTKSPMQQVGAIGDSCM